MGWGGVSVWEGWKVGGANEVETMTKPYDSQEGCLSNKVILDLFTPKRNLYQQAII